SGASGGHPAIVAMALERVDWPRDDPRWYRVLEEPLRFWNHRDSWFASPTEGRESYLACFGAMLARADARARGRFGRTLLHDVVAFAGRMRPDEAGGFATVLLDGGARPHRRDDPLASPPLGWACRWGRVELAQLFLARGADPVEADAAPWATPRAWAEKKGHAEISALLERQT